MKNQVYFPFSQSIIGNNNNNITSTSELGDNQPLQFSDFDEYNRQQFLNNGQQLIQSQAGVNSNKQHSTPLILAMNRLNKQSKSQMRKFTLGKLNEIPGNNFTDHYYQMMPPPQQQQSRQLQQLQLEHIYTHQPQQQQYNNNISRPVNHPQYLRGTPCQQLSIFHQGSAGGAPNYNSANTIGTKTKKRRRRIIYKEDQAEAADYDDDVLLDSEEKKWFNSFKKQTNHPGTLTSDNDESSVAKNRKLKQTATPLAQLLSTREHNNVFSQSETEGPQPMFMGKRNKSNNQTMSRNNNNNSILGYGSLPHIQSNNPNRTVFEHYHTQTDHEIGNTIQKRKMQIYQSGAEPNNNYHSSSSTKISEQLQFQPKRRSFVQQLKSINSINTDAYGLQDQPAISKFEQQPQQVIPLGGGLALKKQNSNIPTTITTNPPKGQFQNTITFRDDSGEQKQLTDAPRISLFNLQIDPQKLEQMQNLNSLSEAEKHELIYDLLKHYVDASASMGIPASSQQPLHGKQIERNNSKSGIKIRENDSLDKSFDKPTFSTIIRAQKQKQMKRELSKKELHPNIVAGKVRNQQVVEDRLNRSDLYLPEKKVIKKSLSPHEKEQLVQNLTTNRHVNKYCRHCYLKALQEEQKTKKNHMVIYDSNNCRKFIEKIKQMNKHMRRQYRQETGSSSVNIGHSGPPVHIKNFGKIYKNGEFELLDTDRSLDNSARLAQFARIQQRMSQHHGHIHNSSLIGNSAAANNLLNKSSESVADLLPRHQKKDSIAQNLQQVFNKKRGSFSNDVNTVVDQLTSNYILGGRNNKAGNDTTMRSSTIQAGNYTIDVIRKSSNNNKSPKLSQRESAKFQSPTGAGGLIRQILESSLDGQLPQSALKSTDSRKKLVEIKLAPEVLDEFERRRAKYVIRKNKEETESELKRKQDSNQKAQAGPKKITTYYERCKQRRQQLYGNKSQVQLVPPTPPIEFEGPFLNVEVRIGSAPRSVHSVALSAFELEMKDLSLQIGPSHRDHSIQMEPDKQSLQMQTTQLQFFDAGIATDPPPEPFIIIHDTAVQTDQIGLPLLKRGVLKSYPTYSEYEECQSGYLPVDVLSARTHNKSVQAKTKIINRPVKFQGGPDKNGPNMYHYLFELKNQVIQCEIDWDEQSEEREKLLRNAVQMVITEPIYEQIRKRAEAVESYPTENYDWRQSGLYKLILKRYHIEKEQQMIRSQKMQSKNNHQYVDDEYRNDPGYRASLGIIMGYGDSHEVISIENSQDASSNFNTQKDVQEQLEDLNNLNPDNLDIFKEMEVTYMASLLKKKASSINNQQAIHQIHQKALTTLTVLTANLIQGEPTLDHILSHYKDPSYENVTRLLLRCKKMYDARVDVKKILHAIIHSQDLLNQLLVKRETPIEEQCLMILRKLQSMLSNFKHENKIFKAKFIFDNVDYYNEVSLIENAIVSGEYYRQHELQEAKIKQQISKKIDKPEIDHKSAKQQNNTQVNNEEHLEETKSTADQHSLIIEQPIALHQNNRANTQDTIEELPQKRSIVIPPLTIQYQQTPHFSNLDKTLPRSQAIKIHETQINNKQQANPIKQKIVSLNNEYPAIQINDADSKPSEILYQSQPLADQSKPINKQQPIKIAKQQITTGKLDQLKIYEQTKSQADSYYDNDDGNSSNPTLIANYSGEYSRIYENNPKNRLKKQRTTEGNGVGKNPNRPSIDIQSQEAMSSMIHTPRVDPYQLNIHRQQDQQQYTMTTYSLLTQQEQKINHNNSAAGSGGNHNTQQNWRYSAVNQSLTSEHQNKSQIISIKDMLRSSQQQYQFDEQQHQ